MKIGIIGDFACPTGLGAVNHALAREFAAAGHRLSVLAVNYHGDPHDYPYRLYPASAGGHLLGVNRVTEFVRAETPDVLLIHFDPWIVRRYLAALAELPPLDRPPVVAYVPVDGTGYPARDVVPLNACAHVLAYTEFGARELRMAGYTAPITVAPLGIDLATWRPMPQVEARAALSLPPDGLIVLVADRNQSRKRIDLALQAFACIADELPAARLVYHGAPEEPTGYPIKSMAVRLGLAGRVGLTMPDADDPAPGLPDDVRRLWYCASDIKLSTAMGEGWGLTTAEAMACGVACVAVDWAAIPEWAAGAVRLVPATSTVTYTPSGHQGGAADPEALGAQLWDLAIHPRARAGLAARGLARMQEPHLRWTAIADTFERVFVEATDAVYLPA